MNRLKHINGKEYLVNMDAKGHDYAEDGFLNFHTYWIERLNIKLEELEPDGSIYLMLLDFNYEPNRPWFDPEIKSIITPDMIWSFLTDKGYKTFVSGANLKHLFEVFAIKPIDRYASLVPVLKHILSQKPIINVLEFGPGHNSTKLFMEHNCQLKTVEMQSPEWYYESKNTYKQASVHYAEGADNWKELAYSDRYDLILVDGHIDSRPEVANWAKDHTDIVVIHDTEAGYYGWERLDFDKSWQRFDYTDHEPHTTVFYKTDLKF